MLKRCGPGQNQTMLVMNRILLILLVGILVMPGCASSRRYMRDGNYDAAVMHAVRELRRNPGKSSEAEILVQAYRIANERDSERIRLLKMENRPASYDEIYLLYQRMHDRQSEVRTVTPLRVGDSTIDFEYVDYMAEMVKAKRKAADFYYEDGIRLMENETKESCRQAYYQFIRAREYVGDYPDIDRLIYESRARGMSRVLMTVQNHSIINFPPAFKAELLTLDLPRLNSEWVEYHTEHLDPNTTYDYLVYVNLKSVAVSPDNQFQRDTLVRREVEDGFTYKLDSNGNVMRDSLGNDIRIPRFRTLQCALIETIQEKVCQIDGDIEIIEMNPNRVIKRDPIGASSTFRHVSARAIGDTAALSAEQRESLTAEPVPFPADIEMVIRTSASLNQAIRQISFRNRRYIR